MNHADKWKTAVQLQRKSNAGSAINETPGRKFKKIMTKLNGHKKNNNNEGDKKQVNKNMSPISSDY